VERRRLHEIGLTLGRDDHDKRLRRSSDYNAWLPERPRFSPAFHADLVFEKN
jgi:hypothetical protein